MPSNFLTVIHNHALSQVWRDADGPINSLLEAIGDYVWDWNLLTDEISFSSSFQQVLGYTEAEFPRTHHEWLEFMHPDDRDRVELTVRSYLTGKKPSYDVEHRVLCKSGKWKWFRCRGAVLKCTDDGTPAQMAALCTDISEHRLITNTHRKSHALLSNFSHHLPGVFYQFQLFQNGRSCFPYVSKAIYEVYEVTAEQVKYDASIVLAKIHPDDRDAVKLAIRESAATMQAWHHEYRVILSKGERWLMGNASPEPLPDGSVLWHGFISDITERKLTEQRLYAAQEQMRLVLKASRQGVFELNLRANQEVFSPEYEEVLGFEKNEMQRNISLWRDRIHPDDWPRVKKAYRRHLSNGKGSDYRAEFRQKTKEGHWKWVMSMGSVVEWDNAGNPIRMLGTHIDISERKQAEENAKLNQALLEASEARYRKIAEELDILVSNAPVGIMFVSDGVIIRANHALAELCDYNSAQKIIGIRTATLCRDENDYAALEQRVAPKLIKDELVELEWILYRRSGQAYRARIVCRALPPSHYKNGAVWMIEDITEQHRTLEALTASEKRLRHLMNSSLIGVVQGNNKGQLTEVNPVFVQMCGYEPDVLMASADFWEELLVEQDHHLCRLAFNELLRTGATAPFELRLNHASGHEVPILVGLTRLENEPDEWVAFVMDMSERHRVSRLKSEFISVVSHELRTPITSIRGSLSLLANEVVAPLPLKVMQLVQIAHNNSIRMISLVNDILDMEKLASGKISLKEESLDLVALVRNALEANMAYMLSLKVSAQLEKAPATALILADSDRLMQVMANLLSNAAKFSAEGDIVLLRILRQGKTYRVEVSDKGPGIPLAFQAHIYEPFTQADGTDSRQQGGTGLGLSITKTLIERMNGQLGFDTIEGEGTTFWFELEAMD